MTQHKSVEAGFTPGLWVVHPLMAWVSPAADIDMPICQLRQSTEGVPADEMAVKADAHLIAAAPALYSALAKAIPILESDLRSASEMNDADWEGQSREAIDMARAALSSARGNQS